MHANLHMKKTCIQQVQNKSTYFCIEPTAPRNATAENLKLNGRKCANVIKSHVLNSLTLTYLHCC